jgi:ABC-2 type transport system ATP-binding protein
MLEINDINLTFHEGTSREVKALKHVNLSIEKGSFTLLLGSNGSGKSTLMNLISGQLFPDSGSIRVFGIDPWTWQGKQLVGYSPDLDYFYPSWSIKDFLARMACLAGIESKRVSSLLNEILSVVGLSSVQTTLLRRCSLGMRQRAKIECPTPTTNQSASTMA